METNGVDGNNIQPRIDIWLLNSGQKHGVLFDTGVGGVGATGGDGGSGEGVGGPQYNSLEA